MEKVSSGYPPNITRFFFLIINCPAVFMPCKALRGGALPDSNLCLAPPHRTFIPTKPALTGFTLHKKQDHIYAYASEQYHI